jgi:P pilus assembly chaperone PapD
MICREARRCIVMPLPAVDTKMKTLLGGARIVFAVACLCAASAHATVVVGATRVIFPAQDGEVTVRLTNEGAKPALVEAWLDRGNLKSTPDTVDAPFLITPPLFRMEAHKDQSLRILAASPSLPDDRESIFWLNVLEIPPKPTTAETQGKNTLQFAIRSRLKFFYRPAHLAGDPLKAPVQLTWTVVADGSSFALEVKNPTPYYITVSDASLNAGGKHYDADSGMVDPMGTLRLAVKGLTTSPAAGTAVAFDTINDYGASSSYKSSIAQ